MDYILLAYIDFNLITSFNVCDVNEFSDHCALQFSMKTNTINEEFPTVNTEYITKIVWNCENVDEFRNSLSNNIMVYSRGGHDFRELEC